MEPNACDVHPMGVKPASGVVVALGFLLSSCASEGARGGAQGVTAGSSLAVTVSSGVPSAAPVAPKSSPVARPIVSSSPTPPATVAPIPSTAVFGYPSVGVLTAAAPRPGDQATIPEATALQEIEHPLSSPRVAGPPRIVGLRRVTAVGGYLSFDGPGPDVLRARHAGVGRRVRTRPQRRTEMSGGASWSDTGPGVAPTTHGSLLLRRTGRRLDRPSHHAGRKTKAA